MKYWIMFYISYCPICASSTTYRERIYDRPKPVDWKDRHDITDSWDYCGAL